MVGGVKQFVTPLNGETLRKIGVLIEGSNQNEKRRFYELV